MADKQIAPNRVWQSKSANGTQTTTPAYLSTYLLWRVFHHDANNESINERNSRNVYHLTVFVENSLLFCWWQLTFSKRKLWQIIYDFSSQNLKMWSERPKLCFKTTLYKNLLQNVIHFSVLSLTKVFRLYQRISCLERLSLAVLQKIRQIKQTHKSTIAVVCDLIAA